MVKRRIFSRSESRRFDTPPVQIKYYKIGKLLLFHQVYMIEIKYGMFHGFLLLHVANEKMLCNRKT
jgi:hypothetical protein